MFTNFATLNALHFPFACCIQVKLQRGWQLPWCQAYGSAWLGHYTPTNSNCVMLFTSISYLVIFSPFCVHAFFSSKTCISNSLWNKTQGVYCQKSWRHGSLYGPDLGISVRKLQNTLMRVYIFAAWNEAENHGRGFFQVRHIHNDPTRCSRSCAYGGGARLPAVWGMQVELFQASKILEGPRKSVGLKTLSWAFAQEFPLKSDRGTGRTKDWLAPGQAQILQAHLETLSPGQYYPIFFPEDSIGFYHI